MQIEGGAEPALFQWQKQKKQEMPIRWESFLIFMFSFPTNRKDTEDAPPHRPPQEESRGPPLSGAGRRRAR